VTNLANFNHTALAGLDWHDWHGVVVGSVVAGCVVVCCVVARGSRVVVCRVVMGSVVVTCVVVGVLRWLGPAVGGKGLAGGPVEE
jgi:hypothetical protein